MITEPSCIAEKNLWIWRYQSGFHSQWVCRCRERKWVGSEGGCVRGRSCIRGDRCKPLLIPVLLRRYSSPSFDRSIISHEFWWYILLIQLNVYFMAQQWQMTMENNLQNKMDKKHIPSKFMINCWLCCFKQLLYENPY